VGHTPDGARPTGTRSVSYKPVKVYLCCILINYSSAMDGRNQNPGTPQLILRTLRPRQWIKSSFVLAPALFTLQILNPTQWLPLLTGVFGFSFIASAIYAFNDITNRYEDRLHLVKKHRPVAEGSLSIGTATWLSVGSVIIGIGLLYWGCPVAIRAALTYAVLMIVYSIYLRHILILDVIIIAAGFVIRVMLGASIIIEPLSNWLLLCTFTIALFLAMIKRRQEMVSAFDRPEGDEADSREYPTRAVLTKYPGVSVIDGWINVLAAMTILCYALYTVDEQTIAKHNTDALIYTLPFVLYGIFRYQQLALVGRAGEDPTKLLLKDTGIKLAVLLWVITSGVILYMSRAV